MANMEESKSNHLGDIATKLATFKQSQPLMEAPILPAEATGDLKDNTVEV